MEEKTEVSSQETPNTDVAVETTTTENKDVVKEESNEWIAPSEEQYKKTIQSERSKAKLEVLREFGVKNIEEFKNLKDSYENAIKDSESVKSQLNEANEKYAKLEHSVKLDSLGVAAEFREDFDTLMKAQLRNPEDYDKVAEAILQRNPTWRENAPKIKMGVEKAEVKETGESSEYLKKKYPWIK